MTLICLITNEAFHSGADYFITLQMVKGTRFSSFSSIKERWIAKKRVGFFCYSYSLTLPTAEILSGKNARAFLFCGFLMKSFKKKCPENMKKILGAV